MTVHLTHLDATHRLPILPLPANLPGGAYRSEQVSLQVVVPCYNEEQRLDRQQFIAFARTHRDIRFVFVDDGSRDGTLKMLKALQRRMAGQATVLALPQNMGKAEAVRAGLRFAATTDSPYVAYWDADLATPLSAILDFRQIAQRYDDVDVVFGSRMQLLGHRIDRTIARRIVSRICSGLARMAVRLPVRDTQCGAKLLRNTPALRRSVDAPFTAGWLFDVELFARLSEQLNHQARPFYEFPLSEWTEVAGSKVTGRVIVKSGFRMLKLVLDSRLGRSRPALLPALAGQPSVAA